MSKRGKVSCLQLLTLLRYFFFFSFFYKILPSKYNIKMDIMNHFKVPHNNVTQAEIVETTFCFRFRFLKYPLFLKVVSFRVPEI